MARTGSCLCGEITYTLEGEDHPVAVCHCEHCIRQGGSAFSLNMIGHIDQLTINGPIKTFEDRGENGDAVYVRRKFCGNCGSPIVSEVNEPPGMVAIKVGSLDDRNDVQPIAQAWCVNKMPWVDIQGVHEMEYES